MLHNMQVEDVVVAHDKAATAVATRLMRRHKYPLTWLTIYLNLLCTQVKGAAVCLTPKEIKKKRHFVKENKKIRIEKRVGCVRLLDKRADLMCTCYSCCKKNKEEVILFHIHYNN